MMVTKADLLRLVTPFKNNADLLVSIQSTKDIIEATEAAHELFADQYDRIYHYFDANTLRNIAKNLFDFCRKNLKYNIESGDAQTVKSPAAILQPGAKIDCKHYALFCGGVIDAIKRNEDSNIKWFYRFASYNNSKHVGHVFVVLMDGGNEIWIDPIPEIAYFDEKRPFNFKIDKSMSLYLVSGGIGAAPGADPLLTVDKAAAWKSFQIMVMNNYFGLLDLLKANRAVTLTAVRNYARQNGFDFSLIERLVTK